MKILCVISHLGHGGAEHVMKWLTESLANRGHSVILACLSAPQSSAHGIPQGVKIRYLDISRPSGNPAQAVRSNLGRILTLRRLARQVKPDVALGFMSATNVILLAALAGTRIPVVVAEHTDPLRADPGRIWRLGRRCLYPRAAALVLLSEGMRKAFSNRVTVEVFPNPVIEPAGSDRELPRPGRKRLVAVGRLHPAKRFDLLIEAFAAADLAGWELVILGEGSERRNLEDLAVKLGLGDRFALPGYREDPFPVYRGANAMALSSSVEGFPVAMIEAMACGLPVIATDCSPAISEILEGGRLGTVAPLSRTAFKEELARFLHDEDGQQRLSSVSRQVINRFRPESVLARWESLLMRFTQRGNDLSRRMEWK